MQSLNFDEGFKEYALNNDESRIIRFNPSDVSFIERADSAMKKLQAILKSIEIEDIKIDPTGNPVDEVGNAVNAIKASTKALYEVTDELFYPGVAEMVFKNVSPLATVNGVTVFENFINGFLKIVKPAFEEEQKKASSRMEKYKKQYDKLPIA